MTKCPGSWGSTPTTRIVCPPGGSVVWYSSVSPSGRTTPCESGMRNSKLGGISGKLSRILLIVTGPVLATWIDQTVISPLETSGGYIAVKRASASDSLGARTSPFSFRVVSSVPSPRSTCAGVLPWSGVSVTSISEFIGLVGSSVTTIVVRVRGGKFCLKKMELPCTSAVVLPLLALTICQPLSRRVKRRGISSAGCLSVFGTDKLKGFG